jgi:hypothetical protein
VAPGTISDQDPCGNNGWPGDLTGDNKINIADINSFLYPTRPVNDGHGTFNKFSHLLDDTVPFGTVIDAAMARWNLQLPPHTPTTLINIGDYNSLISGSFGSGAFPPMFEGQQSFGKTCPGRRNVVLRLFL